MGSGGTGSAGLGSLELESAVRRGGSNRSPLFARDRGVMKTYRDRLESVLGEGSDSLEVWDHVSQFVPGSVFTSPVLARRLDWGVDRVMEALRDLREVLHPFTVDDDVTYYQLRAPLVIAIDGPAGSGKTTIVKALQRHFPTLPVLDTGALYRCVAFQADQAGQDWADESAMAALAEGLCVAFEGASVLLEGVDVTNLLQTAHIASGASQVSALPRVRAALLELQQSFANLGCIASGRDTGTVLFPEAAVKVYLTASLESRAERRLEPGQSLEEAMEALSVRDTRDSTRKTAPLRKADDAVEIDSTEMSVEAVVAEILRLERSRSR